MAAQDKDTDVDVLGAAPQEFTESVEQGVSTPSVEVAAPPKKRKTGLIVAIIATAIIIVAGGATLAIWLFPRLFGNALTVNDLKFTQWRLIDSNDDWFYEYEGTVVSDQTKPFIAVIGSYTDEDSSPGMAYMENGQGIFDAIEFDEDDDPSTEHRPIGYITGLSVSNDDFTEIKYRDYDYFDYTYLKETSCHVEVTVQMAPRFSGILFYDLINNETSEVTRARTMVVVDGIGSSTHYISDLPSKLRGVSVEIEPKFFCPMSRLKEQDYTTKTPFRVTQDKGEYTTSFSGSGTFSVSDREDGFVIYTATLTKGGERADRGKAKGKVSYLHNGEFTVSTYWSSDNDDNAEAPSYEMAILGYISWKDY